jgi:hypothetical protein
MPRHIEPGERKRFIARQQVHLFESSASWGSFANVEQAKKEAERLERMMVIATPRVYRRYSVLDSKGNELWSKENRQMTDREREK